MTTEKKRSAAVVFLGLYFILLGVLWLSNNMSPVRWEEMEAIKYEGRKGRLNMIRRAGEQYEFKGEAQKKEFDVQYGKMKAYVERSDPKKAQRIPWINWSITAFIMMTAVAYVFSGILLLRGFKRFYFYFLAGQCGFIVSYWLGIWATIQEFLPVSMQAKNVIQVLYPKARLATGLDLLLALVPYFLMWFGVFYGVYIILPKVMIRRSKAIGSLLKEESSPVQSQ